MKNKSKKSKIIWIIISIVGGGLIGLFIASQSLSGGLFNKDKVVIRENVTNNIEFEAYDNGLMSMQIPKGWNVKIHPNCDYIHYTFMVENPNNPNYRIYFNLKAEGFLASESDRVWYASLYPNSDFANIPAIDPQTVEEFYSISSEAARGNNIGDFIYPTINDFSLVDYLGNNVTGGEIIRANYYDEYGNNVDGIFTATIMPVSLYYVTALNVYNAIFYTTPVGELVDWQNILNYCVSTINFSETFTNGFYYQEDAILQTSFNLSAIASQTSDIITSGWYNRQATYDVISQKQSDATMGYERVIDTDTGDIYKAYLGFSDNNSNDRYQLVVDDSIYLLPTTGYIE